MNTWLETKRLKLIPPQLNHLENLHLLQSDPDVMKYIGRGEARTLEEVRTGLQSAIQHQLKHGFSLGSVFDKTTGEFVGRAGLIYLAYDDTQHDIEVGYALLKQYWHQGYGTELAQALIAWGFKHLSVDKLVGIVKPGNEASRHVLEKAGMHYLGFDRYRNLDVVRYEILKNPIDHAHIEMVPATLDDYPVMQNLARFYVYDMSEFLGQEPDWEMPANGLYECFDLKIYWEKENSFPFLIKYKNELAGFVIIDKTGTDANVDFNMAQFFILRKFKHKGVGGYVARQCFTQYQGTWEVRVMPRNEGAYQFWRQVIKNYTKNHFREYSCPVLNKPNEHRNLFRFSSISIK